MKRSVVIVGAITALGCGSANLSGAPRTFNRPVQTAFVCLEASSGRPRSLGDCVPNAPSLAMHALVLQDTRAEIAAVNLDSRAVYDLDPSVPGYTFLPVGERPTSLVVPAQSPTCAFVASAATRQIEAIDLGRLHPRGVDVLHAALSLPAEPAEVIFGPDEDALWIALPDRGTVARVGVTGCEFGELREFALSPTAAPPAIWDGSGDLTRVCPVDFSVARPAPSTPRALAADADPTPTTLTLGDALYVGDAALPFIHRLDARTGEILGTLDVGARIRDVVATPQVPATFDPTDERLSRYLYAIDDEDGTVLAVDISTPGSPGFGAVVPVGPEGSIRPDRIPLRAPARTLGLLAPAYDPSAPFAAQCNPAAALPADRTAAPAHSVLRGVFLGVGLLDGSVRFVDVYDSDAPCRGQTLPASAACDGAEPFVMVRRHRARLGQLWRTVGSRASEVAFYVDGAAVRISPEAPSVGPGLVELDCDGFGLTSVFGEDANRALVCAQRDPGAAIDEVWSATWNGALARGQGQGRLSVRGTDVIAELTFSPCEAGALGATNTAGLEVSAAERGVADVLTIAPTAPEWALTDAGCQAVFGIDGAARTPRPIRIRVRESHDAMVVLEPTVLDRPTVTTAEAARCLGRDFVGMALHTEGSFSVIGSRSGQRHRVVTDVTGACRVDTSLPASWQPRAAAQQPYSNGIIAFQVASRPVDSRTTELRLGLGLTPATLNVDVGAPAVTGGGRNLALPADIEFNSVRGLLYIVDVERRGLLELRLSPLDYTQGARFE